MDRQFYTPAEIAGAVGLTSGRIYQLIHDGELPAVRIGGRIRVPVDAWQEWLRQKRAEAGEVRRGEPVAA